VTKAVLFDLDGVLIDSHDAWFEVVNDAARSLGAPAITRERFRGVWGQGISADVQHLYPGRTHDDVAAAYARAMPARTASIAVNPDAATVLDALRSRGVRTACVTNTQPDLARAILEGTRLLSRFDVAESPRPGVREKPAPDMLLSALSRLGVAAADALMVGDSRYDEEAARAAGVAFLRFDWRERGSLVGAVEAVLRPEPNSANNDLAPGGTPMTFSDLRLRDFVDALASDAPTPGGGTGAAAAGALGAALVRMLATLTLGRPKYASAEPLMKAIAEQAGENAKRLLALADEDARSYDAVSAAMKMPKATDAEKAARKTALDTAMRGAIEPPLKVMEACLDTIALAKSAVAQGNVNAVSDGAAGAELARAAMNVASYNVRINLVGLPDDRWAKDVRTRLDEMLYMGTTAASEIDSKVQEMWKRKPASLPVIPSNPPRPA
jgi:methenyltetrahydrofolate cyclohydrolase